LKHSIKITGIAPPELSSLAEPLRRQFWSLVAPIALKVKDAELAAGLDAQGDPLKPISAATRKNRRSAMTPSGKGDPAAPPLMPAYQKSRVRSLLAGRAFATHAELYWRYDPFTGASFEVILNYQRAMGRDVFGVSEEGMARIKALSLAAWTRWKKSGLAPTEKRSAFASAALEAGPQSRIAVAVARSAEPNAGATAPVAVGKMSTRWITRGIEAPTVKELKASTTRTGAMTREELRRFYTAEIPKPRPPRADLARKPKPPPDNIPVFPSSKATIDHGPDTPDDVRKAIRGVFGKPVVLRSLATAIGAPDDATVTIRGTPGSSLITYIVKGPKLDTVYGNFERTAEGVVHYPGRTQVSEPDRGQGIGARLFGRRVDWGSRIGVIRMETNASAAEGDNGYITWAVFGYNGPIPEKIREDMPESLKKYTTIQELLTDKDGIDWWAGARHTIAMTFDLKPGSKNRQQWADYWQRRFGSKP
jgi:hypothetical protein